MMSYRTRRILAALLLSIAVFISACGKTETRWDNAQQTSQKTPATSSESVAGGSFNKFFPKGGSGFDLTYAQEKTGFAQATLKKGGKAVATLSVSDTTNTPDAVQKFKQSKEKLAGYPVVDVGNNGTAILVANRYQVQARSSDSSFSKFDREDWIKKFDLAGLSKLK